MIPHRLPAAPATVAYVGVAVGLALASCSTDLGGASNRSVPPATDGYAGASPSDAENATSGFPDSGAPYVPEDSQDPVNRSLAVIIDGQTIYLRNGGRVILGDGLAADIFADPYPQSLPWSTLDFYLTRDGSPVSGAGVGIDYDMLGMSHGPFSAGAGETGAGHYLVSVSYIESGFWALDVAISVDLDRVTIHLVVLVVD